MGVYTLGKRLRGKSFLIKIDNTTAACALTNRTCRNKTLMRLLRQFLMMIVRMECRYWVEWVGTRDNARADALSRGQWQQFRALCKQQDITCDVMGTPARFPDDLWQW